jgi:hypothetical protein
LVNPEKGKNVTIHLKKKPNSKFQIPGKFQIPNYNILKGRGLDLLVGRKNIFNKKFA